MKDSFNILICGVGGQGSILARKIACAAFIRDGYDIKASEVHGMAQRGGSVVTHFRAGTQLFSPLVEEGQADYILGFEPLEALRYLPYLKNGGNIILNTHQVLPMPVLTGESEYPHDIRGRIETAGGIVKEVEALQLALEAGSPKVMNVVLLGVLAQFLPLPKEIWLEAVDQSVPPAYRELNRRAFVAGYSLK